MLMTDKSQYRDSIEREVATCLSEKSSQPILFLGSGISRRYFNAPRWSELLAEMAHRCPLIVHDFAYYEQSYPSLRHVGSEFAEQYKEWAWSSARESFPEEFFTPNFPKEIFLKAAVADYFGSITPATVQDITNPDIAGEIEILQKIRPHALVTTNYDRFIEILFPEYEPVIGQRILRSDSAFFGEIFKIHGCVSNPRSLVLTEEDYTEFSETKKYLSAKLLTFFLEHPVLFAGYSAEDPNIKAILSDIDLILAAKGELIPNIFLLRRPKGQFEDGQFPREELIPVGDNRWVRIQAIVSKDWGWVFEAFTSTGAIERVRPKLLRMLLARTCDLVRHDIPKRAVEVDYAILEKALESDGDLARLLGITVVGDATHVNVGYPFSLTQVGEKLGFTTWHGANKILEKIRLETGHDLKTSDNKYHVAVRAGKSLDFHKYSPHAVELLRSVMTNPDLPVVLDLA
jgi:SIR2-like domain